MLNYLTLTRRAVAKHKVSHNQENPAFRCLRSLLNRITESAMLEKTSKIKVSAHADHVLSQDKPQNLSDLLWELHSYSVFYFLSVTRCSPGSLHGGCRCVQASLSKPALLTGNFNTHLFAPKALRLQSTFL